MATATSTNDAKTTGGFSGFHGPKFDPDALASSYKKNLEIWGLINKMSMEVFNGIVKLQSALWQETTKDMASAIGQGGKPSEISQRISRALRDCTISAVNNSKQLSDIIMANSNEIFGTFSKGLKDSFDNFKATAQKA
ncbi:MAG: hypothetical protein LBG20_01355 [Holosporaceae bacterium]|jgi:hypothetical protein|nr:hypothetical protein [Holosporaceae bacterium]